MTHQELKNKINGLITDKTTTEEAEAIATILKNVDELANDYEGLTQKLADTNKKYVSAIKNNSFVIDEQNTKEEKALTIEECVEQVLAQRKSFILEVLKWLT